MTGQALKSDHQYSPVQETHDLEEARELLMSLLADITRFHSLNNLRSWEKTGANNDLSEKKIEELSDMRENILEMLSEVDEDQLSIEVSVEIKAADKKSRNKSA